MNQLVGNNVVRNFEIMNVNLPKPGLCKHGVMTTQEGTFHRCVGVNVTVNRWELFHTQLLVESV